MCNFSSGNKGHEKGSIKVNKSCLISPCFPGDHTCQSNPVQASRTRAKSIITDFSREDWLHKD